MVSRTETILLFSGFFILIVALLVAGRGATPYSGGGENPKPSPSPSDPPSEFDKSDLIDLQMIKFATDCVSKRGVVALSANTAQCLQFVSGTLLSELAVPTQSADSMGYLKYVYPLYPNWDKVRPSVRDNFLSKLTFSYISVPGTPKGLSPIDSVTAIKYDAAPIFFNTSHVEVYPLEQSFKNFSRDTWRGCWYRGTLGSGWFLPVSCSLVAYNSVHALLLLSVQTKYMVQFGSSSFRNLASTTSIETIVARAASPTFDGAWLNGEFGPQRYLAQIAVQQGYKTIQLSNERSPSGRFERWVVHLTDPNYSQRDLVRRNPFSLLENSNQDALYLNAFLNPAVAKVDLKFVVDPNPKSLGERYGDFSFKTKCRESNGTISMGDLLLDCLKILNYGLPAVTLSREIDSIDFASYPQSNDLEKLQSYFSIVYGSPQIWKTKTLLELTDYWVRCEVHYKLSLAPKIPYNQYRQLNFGTFTSSFLDARQEILRPGEVVQFVEVVRQNKIYSRYETPEVFAATYYYTARGSGLFLPTGRMFVARDKQEASAAVSDQAIPSCCLPEDIALAKTCLYKGFDTLLIVRYKGGYTGNATELIHFRDPIASQMSLIRTHPYDPLLQIPNTLIDGDGYFTKAPLDIANCVIYKQYEPGKQLNKCSV
jgi:hypothetical protein